MRFEVELAPSRRARWWSVVPVALALVACAGEGTRPASGHASGLDAFLEGQAGAAVLGEELAQEPGSTEVVVDGTEVRAYRMADGLVGVMVLPLDARGAEQLRNRGLEPKQLVGAYRRGEVALYTTQRERVYLGSHGTEVDELLVAADVPGAVRTLDGWMTLEQALEAFAEVAPWVQSARLRAYFHAGPSTPESVHTLARVVGERLDAARAADQAEREAHAPANDRRRPAGPPAPPPDEPAGWPTDVAALEAAARQAALAGRSDVALVWAEAWLAAAPKDLEAHLVRALALEGLQAWVPLVEATDAALALSPPESRGLIELLSLRARALALSGVPEAAVTDLRRASGVAGRLGLPLEAIAALERAVFPMVHGPAAMAARRARLRAALKASPGDALLAFVLARDAALRGEPGADAPLEAAARAAGAPSPRALDPTWAASRRAALATATRDASADAALLAGDLLVSLDPTPEQLLDHAKRCEERGLLEDALFLAALASATSPAAATWLLAVRDATEEALAAPEARPLRARVELLRRAVRIEPGRVDHHVELAGLLLQAGLLDGAAHHARAAWRCGVTDRAEALRLREVALRAGDFRLLAAIADQLVVAGACDATDVYTRALAAAGIGDGQRARADLQALLSLGLVPTEVRPALQLLEIIESGIGAKAAVALGRDSDGLLARLALALALRVTGGDVAAAGLDPGPHREYLAGPLSRRAEYLAAVPVAERSLATFVTGLVRSFCDGHDDVAGADLAAAAAAADLPAFVRAVAAGRLAHVAEGAPRAGPPGPRDAWLVPLDAPTVDAALERAASGQRVELAREGGEVQARGRCLRLSGRGSATGTTVSLAGEAGGYVALSGLVLERPFESKGALLLDGVGGVGALGVHGAALARRCNLGSVLGGPESVLVLVDGLVEALKTSGQARLDGAVTRLCLEASGAAAEVVGEGVVALGGVAAAEGGRVALRRSVALRAGGPSVVAVGAGSSVEVTRAVAFGDRPAAEEEDGGRARVGAVLAGADPSARSTEPARTPRDASGWFESLPVIDLLPGTPWGDGLTLEKGVCVRGSGDGTVLGLSSDDFRKVGEVVLRGEGVTQLRNLSLGRSFTRIERGLVLLDEVSLGYRLVIAPGATVVWRGGSLGALEPLEVEVARGGRLIVQEADAPKLLLRGEGSVILDRPRTQRLTTLPGGPRLGGPPRVDPVHDGLRRAIVSEAVRAFDAAWYAARDPEARKAAAKELFRLYFREQLVGSPRQMTWFLLDQVAARYASDRDAAFSAILGAPSVSTELYSWVEQRAEPSLRADLKARGREFVQAFELTYGQGGTTELMVQVLRRWPVGSEDHEVAVAATRRVSSLAEVERAVAEAIEARARRAAELAAEAEAARREAERWSSIAAAQEAADRGNWFATSGGGGYQSQWDGPGSVQRAIDHLEATERQNRSAWLSGAQSWH